MPKVIVSVFIKWCICTGLLLGNYCVQAQYRLQVLPVDRDTAFIKKELQLQTSFTSREACFTYINNLRTQLQLKGFAAASIDSLYYDSATAHIDLFVGQQYQLAAIYTNKQDEAVLQQAGWNTKALLNKPLQLAQLQQLQQNLLNYFEDNGYPFAALQLDSIQLNDGSFSALLHVNRGRLYKIDSIRIFGAAVINNLFMQRYLDIKNGAIYQKSKLQNINKRIAELSYVQQQQPWDLTMLGTGSLVNLYLQPKKSSQVNVLLGFLPANQFANNGYENVRTKLMFTGEANINLRNVLGNGELMALNWQQIQPKSPRLNLQYQQPYIAGTPFGINTTFDLFRKDSSFLNLNFTLGALYALSVNQTGKIYFQAARTNLLSVDTASLRLLKRLPNEIDVSASNIGIEYELNKTNYRLNPRKGFEFYINTATGLRKIRKNNVIVNLKDPGFQYASLYDSIKLNTYQFKLKAVLARYFSLTRQSVLKTAVTVGWIQSPTIFRNELFQIGGYKLLRGFDEESIFASAYTVVTAEYRYLVGTNSYFFVFTDGAWAKNNSVNLKQENSFIGAGLGLSFETKAGIFNISYATGKRNDVKFDLRQSKIHLGFVSYF
ncbi:MAG: hypothetical protein EAZ16_08495 [Sphingobacteriales bacterium]|nr:MAG: hypothetical protein EAZ16_08495 [Sphingobacteriales bacterium]